MISQWIAAAADRPGDAPYLENAADGRTLTTEVDPSLGRADTDETLTAKYRDCAAVYLDDDRARQLYDQVMAIEEAESVADFLQLLG